jgi:hypothetical protein
MPPQTGILNLYPTLTPEFMSWDESIQEPKAIRARRFWMSATLVLGWQYRQKRRETVHFTIHQHTQLDGKIRPLTRQLNLHLQHVANEAAGTFFLTYRGRQAIEHALEMARAHLAASARCLEVEIIVPFECGFPLSMDHSIRLVDPRIPGGEVVGKVVAYQLHQDGLQTFAWVRFAASIGGRVKDPPTPKYIQYAEYAYADTSVPEHHQTVSGLVYASYANQKPTGGIVELETLSIDDILPEVLVNHDADRQIHILERQQYPVQGDVKGVLENIPTVVSLNLLSLKTTAVAEHLIYLNLLNAWTPPCQVKLTGDLR